MKRNLLFLFTALSLNTLSAEESPALVINELMQSNIDCIMDDLNEFPDSWVELYNNSLESINLKDYLLGVKTKASKAWQLPEKIVGAKEHVIIYCDKEETGLHTNFRLESGKGCVVYLFKGKEIVDSLPEALKKQPAPNISYGRKTDGDSKWGYQLEPTPGKENCGKTSKNILGEPIFSEPGKVLTDNKTLSIKLSLPEGSPEGTVIRYTTDGTEPTATSTKARGSITINSSKCIRAKLFCDDWLSPRSTVQSYLFLGHKMTIPVISITTKDDYLNSAETGIFHNNKSKENPINWRRPITFELFVAPEEKSVLNQLCETRVMGGQSRTWMKKSMAIYANKRFGAKRLEYEFFPDQKPGLTDFKSIMLRNAGNDCDYLYMRDAIIQRTMAQNADLDWQAWRPAVVFINGQYYAMLNIRERSNEDNIYTNYDGLEDIVMIEILDNNKTSELKEGTKDNYNKFVKFYKEKGHTLAEYEQWMDWREFINLMAMNLYFNNQDFPGNNMVMWRPSADGGKWRWISKDTDFGLGLYGSPATYKTLEWLYNPNYDKDKAWANSTEATLLFQRLMADEDFNREFIDRCAIYMGDFLNENGTRKIWDPMYEMIKTEYPYHRKLINEWWPNYNDELRNARNWLKARTSEFYKQLGAKYYLGTPETLTVNLSTGDIEGVKTIVNGIPLRNNQLNGMFYPDRQVTLSCETTGNMEIKGWKIQQVSANGTQTIEEKEGSVYTFPMPTCKALNINAILYDKTGINEAKHNNWSWMRTDTQIILSDLKAGTPVSLYDLKGICLYNTTADGTSMQLPASTGKLYLLKVGGETVKIK